MVFNDPTMWKFKERELEIMWNFKEKYPNISELKLDIINMVAYTAIELRDENPNNISHVKQYFIRKIDEGIPLYGIYKDIKFSEEEKIALKGLVYKLIYLKEE